MIYSSMAMLELRQKKQGGLSFRAIEALGMKKKLITTCMEIKEYDFYDENNILVISEDNPIIDVDFFKTPYKEIDKKTYEKYSLDSWVRQVLS